MTVSSRSLASRRDGACGVRPRRVAEAEFDAPARSPWASSGTGADPAEPAATPPLLPPATGVTAGAVAVLEELACVPQFAAQLRTTDETSFVHDGLTTSVARKKCPYLSNPLMAPVPL